MTLAIVVALSQLADGLAYQLVHGRGTELNPGAATVIAAYGPGTILVVKVIAALVTGARARIIPGSRAQGPRSRGSRVTAVVGTSA